MIETLLIPFQRAFVFCDRHAIVTLKNTADVIHIRKAYMLAGLGEGIAVAADQNHHVGQLAAVDVLHQSAGENCLL